MVVAGAGVGVGVSAGAAEVVGAELGFCAGAAVTGAVVGLGKDAVEREGAEFSERGALSSPATFLTTAAPTEATEATAHFNSCVRAPVKQHYHTFQTIKYHVRLARHLIVRMVVSPLRLLLL